jgi:hypothetical protein
VNCYRERDIKRRVTALPLAKHARACRSKSRFYKAFTEELNPAFTFDVPRCGGEPPHPGTVRVHNKKGAPHNDQAVKSQHLAFQSRRRDIYYA